MLPASGLSFCQLEPNTLTRIISIESSNVKRLRAVRIEPDGSLFIVGGENEQGKSSLLDSIAMALGGKHCKPPPEPVRKGERRAKTVIELDNGLVVKRTFDAAGGSRLVVTDAEGVRQSSPQTILDKLWGSRAVDPMAFARLTGRAQADLLRELVGLDTVAIDEERAAAFDERTVVKRALAKQKAQLDAMPKHDDAPDAAIDVAALASQLESIEAARRGYDDLRATLKSLTADELSADEKARYIGAEITTLEAALAAKRETHAAACAVATSKTDARVVQNAIVRDLVDPDPLPVREQLASASEINTKVRANIARADVAIGVRTEQNMVDELCEKLEDIDARRLAMLEALTFPVDGLGFDEDGVTYQGVPFSQASQAAKIRVSVALVLAQKPDLRVLLIREGSFLDGNGLKLLAEAAEKHDAQVFLELATRNDADEAMCSVIIEDGMVKETAKAAAK